MSPSFLWGKSLTFWRQPLFWAGAFLLTRGPFAFGQDKPLPAKLPVAVSLAGALEMAQSSSNSAAAAKYRVDAAEARVRAASALNSPQLSVAHAYGKDTGGFDEDIILSETFELGKRGAKVRSARALGASARFDQASTSVDLRFNVKSAYYEALRAENELVLAQGSLTSALTFDEAAQNQLRVGDVPRANVVRSGIEVVRARQALADAQTERDNRYAALGSLLNWPPESLVLSDSLGFSPQEYDEGALQELARRQRADLAGANAQQQGRIADVSVAKSANRPDVFVEARRAAITTYSGIPNGQSVRFGFTMPLGDFGARRAAVNEAKAARAEGEANLKESLRTAKLEVSTARLNLLNAVKAVQSFQNGRLTQSKELFEMAQIGYERGANSYLELIDARNVYRAEQTDYARALAAWNVATATLERAVGGQLP